MAEATHQLQLAWSLTGCCPKGWLAQVELRIDKELVVSQRVAVRAGFAPAGTVLAHVPRTGQTYEDLRYTLTAA